MSAKNFMMIATCCGLLVGCAGMELESAKGLTPSGDAFTAGLYEGYLELAVAEQTESDFEDADVFSGRAKRAAAGESFPPEEVSARQLPSDHVGELTDARARLMAAFDKGAVAKIPDQAANAQVMFDCWMQEQEEDIQQEDVEACRAGFVAAMDKIDAALKPAPVAAKPAPKPAARPKPAGPVVVGNYVVRFGFDSAALDANARRIIQQAIVDFAIAYPDKITVTAHTDRAGDPAYNRKLSEARAAAVVNSMSSRGVPSRVFVVDAMGENDPVLITKDGERNDRNRRVEVTFD